MTDASITGNPRTVSFASDANGNLQTLTDVRGKITTFAYNSSHLLTSTTSPRGEVTTDQYDAYGRVSEQVIDPGTTPAHLDRTWDFSYALNSDRHEYDDRDRSAARGIDLHLPGLRARDEDDRGRYAQQATWTYSYDPATRGVTAIHEPATPGQPNRVWAATYDANGNMLTQTNPLNEMTTYTWDTSNREQ